MAIQDNCILWSKLENNISEPGYGPNGINIGVPVYAACKFNNGLRPTNGNYLRYTTTGVFDYKLGLLEKWIKPVGFNIVNARPSDGQFRMIWGWYNAAVTRWQAIGLHGANGMYWYMRDLTGDKNWISALAGFDVPDGVLAHLAFVWDNAHATKKRRVFLNGAEIGSQNVGFGDVDMTNALFHLGTNNAGTGAFGNGILDNIKWYKSVVDLVAILANRNNEGWPVVGGVRLINGGLLQSNMLGGNVLIH